MGWARSPRGKVRHRVDAGELTTACGRLAAGWAVADEALPVCEVCAAVPPPAPDRPPSEPAGQEAVDGSGSPAAAVDEVVVLLLGDDGQVPAHVRPLVTVARGIAADLMTVDEPSAALWKQFREALADLSAQVPAGDAVADLVGDLLGGDAPGAG